MTKDSVKKFIEENVGPHEKLFLMIVDTKENTMRRCNVGLSAGEILGYLFETQVDIMAQMRGEEKATMETFRTRYVPEEQAAV